VVSVTLTGDAVHVCNSATLDISGRDVDNVKKLSSTSLPAASSVMLLFVSSAPAVAMKLPINTNTTRKTPETYILYCAFLRLNAGKTEAKQTR